MNAIIINYYYLDENCLLSEKMCIVYNIEKKNINKKVQ